ncbi:hypothetical protein D9M72_119220 [compost metagenome]
MATAPLLFPALPSGKSFDSSKFSITPNDPGMRHEMEGGYAVTRARFTRKPTRVFNCSLTNITQADKNALETFWDTTRGTSRAFSWTSLQDAKTYNVRFKSAPTYTYRGVRQSHFWDCDIQFETV